MSARRLGGAPPRLVYRIVTAVRNLLARLARRLVPARVALFEQFAGVWLTQMVHAAARLKIAHAPADGPRTLDELAAATGAHRDSLHRLLRALISVGIFARRADGRYAHSRLSRPLRSGSDDSLRDIVLFLGSKHSMLGWAHFHDAVVAGKNGFELAHGKPVFEWLAEHPEDEATFGGGMVAVTEIDLPALVRGFDYGRFATLCDVAGGRGTLLGAILSLHPRLRGVLFDAASVVDAAPPVLRAWGVEDRCTRVAGSFFTEVPPGCDAYVLKEILHDWDDARAGAILEVCRRAMRPGATLLVLEMLVAEHDGPDPAKLLDMEMLDTTMEGRQRTEAEMRALLGRAGFHVERVVALPSPFSIVEAKAR